MTCVIAPNPIADDTSFAAATRVTTVPSPSAPGSAENFSVTGLAANTTYYIAIKAIDKGLNTSPLSNVITVTTRDAERILDLATGTPGSARAPLTWTAIDDGNTGYMTSYDLRYSTALITDDTTFNAATQVTGMLAPAFVGSPESFTVTYLDPGTTYYFAIKGIDSAGHATPLSNIASVTTPAAVGISDLSSGLVAPTKVPLTWTAVDDGSTGTAASYNLRYSTNAIVNDATFDAATAVTGVPTPKAPGSAESFTVTGLQANTTYYFAIKPVDAKSRSLPLSNIVVARTPVADTVAPRWVGNLKGTPSKTAKSIDLTWTAPADYGANGSGPYATVSYDLRYSSSPILYDDGNASWNAATRITGLPAPKAPGAVETLTVTVPAGNTTYYFAIKSSDDGVPPNVSEVSNCAAARSSLLGEKILQAGLNGYTGAFDSYYSRTASTPSNERMMVCGYAGSSGEQRGILKFDLSSIAAGTIVASAHAEHVLLLSKQHQGFQRLLRPLSGDNRLDRQPGHLESGQDWSQLAHPWRRLPVRPGWNVAQEGSQCFAGMVQLECDRSRTVLGGGLQRQLRMDRQVHRRDPQQPGLLLPEGSGQWHASPEAGSQRPAHSSPLRRQR